MKEFFRSIRAELVKMRHTFLYPLHLFAVLCGSGIFLLYYRKAISSEWSQICALGEVIGIALPLAVSLVCAGSVRLEEENHFQVFLAGTVRKAWAFGVKCLILWLMGALTVMGTAACFAGGSVLLYGREWIPAGDFWTLVLILCAGSVPLYLEHLFLNLRFSGAVSLGVGTIQFVLSALFLTGLGNGRWQYFPSTWSARGVALYAGFAANREPGETIGICLLIMAALYAIIRTWFYFYEGRQCDD